MFEKLLRLWRHSTQQGNLPASAPCFGIICRKGKCTNQRGFCGDEIARRNVHCRCQFAGTQQ